MNSKNCCWKIILWKRRHARSIRTIWVLKWSKWKNSGYISICFLFLMLKRDSRFTSYDFKKMQRRSYYPHNHLISTATATSSGLASSRPGTPANDLRVENSGLRIESHDMRMEGGIVYNNSSLEVNGSEEPIKEKDIVDMDNLHLGKEYPWYLTIRIPSPSSLTSTVILPIFPAFIWSMFPGRAICKNSLLLR